MDRRAAKHDTFENVDVASCHDNKKRCKKQKRREKKCDTKCDKPCGTICDRLCLAPPENACEQKNVTHVFKVVLGECKVTRDVKVTHCITANLNHHIKENVLCKHAPCTKYTCEEKHSVNDGKCCDVKFPDCDDDILFVDDCDDKKCHKNDCRKKCDSKLSDSSSVSSSFSSVSSKRCKKSKHEIKVSSLLDRKRKECDLPDFLF